MSYTMLQLPERQRSNSNDLNAAALDFIHNACEGLRFDPAKANEAENGNYTGTSLKVNQIPYNMQMDIDRLCLETSLKHFLTNGTREDAFNVYYCYLEMFIGDYTKTSKIIELLSEFEENGSRLLMKHRDHYSHSVYVFALGLAIYYTNSFYRDTYMRHYGLTDPKQAACHYLQYWGLASLFHDIGYPFELPFEQVSSYFEISGSDRKENPFIAYKGLSRLTQLNETVKDMLQRLIPERRFLTTDALFAYLLEEHLQGVYHVSAESMEKTLTCKPSEPDQFGYYMDHAYFSATVLFQKLFGELACEMNRCNLDVLTAILMHNSLYKFSIAKYKSEGNKPFAAELHPLAFMLMLCDELQCWDRTAYGRNSRLELHPMGCSFDFSGDAIKAVYLFDEREHEKINYFQDSYQAWIAGGRNGNPPKLKAYSSMFCQKDSGKSDFQADIERIVDLGKIRLTVEIGLSSHSCSGHRGYLSHISFTNLINFAAILNGRWSILDNEWKAYKDQGKIEEFVHDTNLKKDFMGAFRQLSLEYKLININQAMAFAGHLNEIDCFFTDKPADFEMLESFRADEAEKIGIMEHKRWLQEHYDMGWQYGTREEIGGSRELLRRHWDLIPVRAAEVDVVSDEEALENYHRIGKAEQDKDIEPMECMLTMLKMFDGMRIYRLNEMKMEG